MEQFNFIVFVEGGYNRDIGRGAFAYIVLDGITEEECISYSSQITDSNSARIYYDALIAALRALPCNCTALVVCDATYLTHIMSGRWKAKANLDIIGQAWTIMRTKHIECKFEWRSIKLQDPTMKRVWRMCSQKAEIDFEKLYEERDKK